MRPGPNGPYKVIARADEAEAKGWEPVTITDEPTAGLPPEEFEVQAHAERGFWSKLFGS
jgi:hypothetical protein